VPSSFPGAGPQRLPYCQSRSLNQSQKERRSIGLGLLLRTNESGPPITDVKQNVHLMIARRCCSCRSWCFPPQLGVTAAGESSFIFLSHRSRSFHSIKGGRIPSAQARTGLKTQRKAKLGLHIRPSAWVNSQAPLCAFRRGLSTSTSRAMEGHKWSGANVRKTFLDFFAERGHTIGKCSQCETWVHGS
jgi:hypothetical protein